MSWYTVGWVTLAVAVGGLELAALLDKRRGDTLSEHVWRLSGFHARRWTWRRAGFAAAITLGLVWLGTHLVLGW